MDNQRNNRAKIRVWPDSASRHPLTPPPVPMPSKTLPTPDQPAVRVVVVAFDGISPFHLAVPCVVFGDRHPGVAPFDFRVCAVDRRLRTTVGFELRVDRGLAALRRADVVIVPSWRDPAEKPPEALTQALRAAHGRGARLVGLCLGPTPWRPPVCSMAVAPRRTGRWRTISRSALRRCRSTAKCSMSTKAMSSPRRAPRRAWIAASTSCASCGAESGQPH